MAQISEEFKDACRAGKLKELIAKLKLIRSLCEECLSYGVKVTIKDEIIWRQDNKAL